MSKAICQKLIHFFSGVILSFRPVLVISAVNGRGVFQKLSPSCLCHMIPSTSMHLPSHTKPLIYPFLMFWKSVFWIVTSWKKTPGLWKSRVGEKKQGLFLYCIFTFLYFMLRLPFWLCFLFSPPWLEVDDHSSGPNLLKAFNKQTVLERNCLMIC